MLTDAFGLPGAWAADEKHWHAYVERNVDPRERAIDRWQRIQREPDAVLRSPEAVAEWIEQRVIELGEKRKTMAIADRAWVEIGDAEDLAHAYGEHVVIAARGDSIYTDVLHAEARIELFVEAVTADDCNHHDH